MTKPVSMTASQTLALVPVLVGLNFTLLMPAAQEPSLTPCLGW